MKDPVMQQEEIDKLIEKYLHGTASPEERERLLSWYRDNQPSTVEWTPNEDEETLSSRIYDEIEPYVRTKEPAYRFGSTFTGIAAAALVIIVAAIGLIFYSGDKRGDIGLAKKPAGEQILPGGDRATLILADGTRVNLDQADNKVIDQESGVTIRKTADGQLTYTFSDPQSNGDAEDRTMEENYNTVVTPAGGKYSLRLSDGSMVYLNASSTLKFPVSFTRSERKILLDGEAYFEVAHNASKPFSVESGDQVVQVLGTHFNVNSYKNEPVIKTTLVEGSVKVYERNTRVSKMLKPGQESNLSEEGEITVAPADTEQALGWKNGVFVFNDLQFADIMRQLERWYNVDVDYSTIPKTRFNGVISRDVPLSKALQMLEVTGGIKFRVEGRTLMISK